MYDDDDDDDDDDTNQVRRRSRRTVVSSCTCKYATDQHTGRRFDTADCHTVTPRVHSQPSIHVGLLTPVHTHTHTHTPDLQLIGNHLYE